MLFLMVLISVRNDFLFPFYLDISPFIDPIPSDNESRNPTGYTTLALTLRTLMDTSFKPFYLSAPQCQMPDASIPMDALTAMDFVFVQFYNNNDCNLGQPGFPASFQEWSMALQTGPHPKLFVAAVTDPTGGTGFVDANTLEGELHKVKGFSNFGGAALWDGSQAIANGGFEKTVKGTLNDGTLGGVETGGPSEKS